MTTIAMLDASVAQFISDSFQTRGVDRMLRTIRKYLGMDVAFISSFRGDIRVFVTVDSADPTLLASGTSMPIEEGYCAKVVTGILPRLIVNAGEHPIARDLPATKAIPIGSHLSVPIELEGGEIYGTLCCFSHVPDLSLGERDLKIMSAFAEMIAEQLDQNLAAGKARHQSTLAIRSAMLAGTPRIVYQPIFDVMTGEFAGVESLSRFDTEPYRSPDVWFNEANLAGVGVELELFAIVKALGAVDDLPGQSFLAVNASPETIMSGKLFPAVERFDLRRLVLEVTEHATVADYDQLQYALTPLRGAGARLAVDDAGAGYASMRHILNLKPEVIKLDMSLTRNIDADLGKRALARGLISFAQEIKSRITAEGVETAGELEMLSQLGVDNVQGYLIGRPMSLTEVVQISIRRLAAIVQG